MKSGLSGINIGSIIGESRGFGLPYGDAVEVVMFVLEGSLELVEKIHRDIFRGWILAEKGRMFIEVAVIQLVNLGVYLLFEDFKINAHTQFIQFAGPDRNLNLPIVTVRFFAVTGIFAQVMGSGKVGFDENVKHGCSSVQIKGVLKSMDYD
jgi:hypothetical protein